MKEYQILEYDANSPVEKAVSVPLFSQYGLAVKVYKDGQQAQLSSSQISVDGTASSGTLRGYHLFELSSGSIPCMKQLDVVVDKQERRTIDGSKEVSNSPTTPKIINFIVPNKPLDNMTLKATDLVQVQAECTISATSGDIEHETLDVSNLWLLGMDAPGATMYSWHVVDGKWENEAGDKTADEIISVLTVSGNAQFKTTKKYGPSTAVCQYSIVLRTSDDVVASFKLTVREKDMGRIDVKEQD